MQKILEKLYLGEISPWENEIRIEEYGSCRSGVYTKIEEFNEELSNKHQKELEEIVYGLIEVHGCESTQAFVNGFKLAMTLVVEGLSE